MSEKTTRQMGKTTLEAGKTTLEAGKTTLEVGKTTLEADLVRMKTTLQGLEARAINDPDAAKTTREIADLRRAIADAESKLK